ncbi:MAG TPA: phospholipid carrier-dependent glycosyltransferase [Tepidisphaeraceae bacterium]|nr:phospholipid carrier-dependent glycosyltransferase [Tepidisphaeraceae bacterium]
MRQRLRLITLCMLGGLVFLLFLGGRDIVTSHEARVAQTAREMAEAGWPWKATPLQVPGVALTETPGGLRLAAQADKPPLQINPWGVPTINGQIRLQKPPLPYWVAAVMYRFTGITGGAARFGPAVLGALCIPLIYDLARRLMGRRAGWVAALLWISSYFIPDEYRKSMADPYLAFATRLCFWAWVRASQGAGWALVLFYVGLGLGILAKGPVLFIHLAVAVAAFHACYRAAMPRGWKSHLAGVVLLAAIAVPWPLYVIWHVPNALVLWRYESIGELTGENVEKAREWFFYLPSLPQLCLPWIAVWVIAWGYPFARRGQARRRLLFPLLWYAGTVFFFSLSAVKKNAYLLPMMPAQVLLIAQAVVGLMAMSRRRSGKWPWLAIEVQKVIGVGWGIAMGAVLLLNMSEWPWGEVPFRALVGVLRQALGQITLGGMALAVLAVAVGVFPLVFNTRRQVRPWFAAQAACYGLLLVLSFVGWTIPWDNARSPRDLVEHVAIAAAQPGYTVSRSRLQETALFYLPNGLAYDRLAEHVLVIVQKRPKYQLDTEDPGFFGPDVPEGSPVAAREVPIKASSARDYWRVYDVTVERK